MDALGTWLVELAFPFLSQCAPVGVIGLAIALAIVYGHFDKVSEKDANDIKDVTSSLSGLDSESKRMAQEIKDLSDRLDRRDFAVDKRLEKVDDLRDRLVEAAARYERPVAPQSENDVPVDNSMSRIDMHVEKNSRRLNEVADGGLGERRRPAARGLSQTEDERNDG